MVNGEPQDLSGVRVLVADDEPPIRLLCQVNLSLAGMQVLQAGDGEEALRVVRAQDPDLVLLDLMMPRMDGWTVAQELIGDEQTKRIPIVFLTARATVADRRRAEELGAFGYILKPFDPVKLAPLLAEIVQRCGRGEEEDIRREHSPSLWPRGLDDR